MKLTATVTGKRAPKNDRMGVQPLESYTVAEATVDGSRGLVGASLRALADAIDPPPAFEAMDTG